MNFIKTKFSFLFILLFSLPVLCQEMHDESKLIQDINLILSNSIGATTYIASVSNNDFIVNCGYNQIFPIDKIDIKKIKIQKQSLEIDNKGRKGSLYYLKLFGNQKGNYVYNEAFAKKSNMMIIIYSHEQEETIQRLKDLIIKLVINHSH
jgi:hypothetical protein